MNSQTRPTLFAEHVKVVNGSSRCNGRVEMYRDGQWKRVCNNEWSKNEESVVCQEINCGIAATESSGVHFGEVAVTGGVKATCTGNETSISACSTEEIRDSCVDATVVCTSKLFDSVHLHTYTAGNILNYLAESVGSLSILPAIFEVGSQKV